MQMGDDADSVSTAEGGRAASSDCATTMGLQMFSVVWWVTRWSPEPVHARPARYHDTTPPYYGYGHYGSQEATTAGHRRMVVQGSLMRSDRALLIFVVARYSVEGCR